jgi:CBS domain containing-hemolysin-like protein
MMVFKIFLLIVIIVTGIAKTSEAYIDPNTGGFFFQTVAPFVYGILGVIVVFWKRIAGFFKGLFSGKKDAESSGKDS